MTKIVWEVTSCSSLVTRSRSSWARRSASSSRVRSASAARRSASAVWSRRARDTSAGWATTRTSSAQMTTLTSRSAEGWAIAPVRRSRARPHRRR
ncbi:hypothetical protein [Nonomuraea sp. NPDC049725]|uniref:hypothetical protein n=1 Tax=Nonomuraea sp. NPDC049725 TaxID=3154508 RepID=UPI00341EA8F2